MTHSLSQFRSLLLFLDLLQRQRVRRRDARYLPQDFGRGE